MHHNHLAVPLRWIALSLVLLASCGPSEEELQRRKEAADDSARVRRWAIVLNLVERDMRTAKQHCRESMDEFRTLLTKDSSLTVQINGKMEPLGQFILGVRAATEHHDSTKSCATLVDSVASATRKARVSGGRQ